MAAPLLDAQQAKDITDAGLGLYCFTVNQADEAARLLAMGVHGVFTDYPEELLARLGV